MNRQLALAELWTQTAGGGGHSELLLQAGHEVIALDRDQEALHEASTRLAKYGTQFRAVHSNFSEIDRALSSLGITEVDGILADFGVSSHQLDEAERGFSFMREGSLDMRMDQTQPRSASDILHSYSEDELKTIFREYGEEKFAGKIARILVTQRQKAPFQPRRNSRTSS